jgi:anti-sigma regulatory factor (Ser/Thr protein kinase)
VPTAEVSVTAESRSAGVARRFLRDTLQRWDAAGYTDNAELVLTELVTNAILHAKTDIRVRVDLGPDGLRLEVVDHSPRQPIARHYSTEATTGRGLGLIEALTSRWGVQPGQAGKTVWAELAPDQPASAGLPDLAEADLQAWSMLGDGSEDRPSGLGVVDQQTERIRDRAA